MASTHGVNSYDIYNEWVDGNHQTHRDVYRKKISGALALTFLTETDYVAFVNAYNRATVDGLTSLTVWVNNIHQEKEIKAYCMFEPVLMKNINTKRYATFDFNLEEK